MTTTRYDTDVAQQFTDEQSELSESQVVQYVMDHPHVLIANPEIFQTLAAEMHDAESLGYESLTLRQMVELRDEKEQLSSLNDALIETGRDYETKLAWLQAATLQLMDISDIYELDAAIGGEHLGHPHVDHSALWLKSDRSAGAMSHIRFVSDDNEFLNDRLFTLNTAVGEAWRADEYAELFDVEIEDPASVALIPIKTSENRAVMTFGSLSPTRFSVSFGTVFLDFLSGVIGRVIDRVV